MYQRLLRFGFLFLVLSQAAFAIQNDPENSDLLGKKKVRFLIDWLDKLETKYVDRVQLEEIMKSLEDDGLTQHDEWLSSELEFEHGRKRNGWDGSPMCNCAERGIGYKHSWAFHLLGKYFRCIYSLPCLEKCYWLSSYLTPAAMFGALFLSVPLESVGQIAPYCGCCLEDFYDRRVLIDQLKKLRNSLNVASPRHPPRRGSCVAQPLGGNGICSNPSFAY